MVNSDTANNNLRTVAFPQFHLWGTSTGKTNKQKDLQMNGAYRNYQDTESIQEKIQMRQILAITYTKLNLPLISRKDKLNLFKY